MENSNDLSKRRVVGEDIVKRKLLREKVKRVKRQGVKGERRGLREKVKRESIKWVVNY